MVSDFNKKQKGRIPKKFYYAFAGIAFAVLSVFFVMADINIYREKQKLAGQVEEYKNQIQEIQKKNNALKQGIAEANNNDYIEKVAREELGLQKQGEKVVTFITPPQQQNQENKPQSFWDSWLGWLSHSWKNISWKNIFK